MMDALSILLLHSRNRSLLYDLPFFLHSLENIPISVFHHQHALILDSILQTESYVGVFSHSQCKLYHRISYFNLTEVALASFFF